jgi:predicted nucleic acid-binding protein
MLWLADTNILLRLMHRGDADHRLVRSALRLLRGRGDVVFYAAQNLVEFWRASTRPLSANGFGLSLVETNRRVKVVERLCKLAPEVPDVHAQWRRLVVAHSVSGIKVHDARLVAVMQVYGIADILTFNGSDFRRCPAISAVHPQQLLAQSQQRP